jgi:hypothetical protein
MDNDTDLGGFSDLLERHHAVTRSDRLGGSCRHEGAATTQKVERSCRHEGAARQQHRHREALILSSRGSGDNTESREVVPSRGSGETRHRQALILSSRGSDNQSRGRVQLSPSAVSFRHARTSAAYYSEVSLTLQSNCATELDDGTKRRVQRSSRVERGQDAPSPKGARG